MSSSGESSCDYPSTTDSLYALPSPQTLRCVAQNRQKSQYLSLCDISPLSLDGAGGPAAYRGASISNKAHSDTASPPHLDPCYSRHEVPEASVHPLSESLPKDSLRIVNRDPPPLVMSSSNPMGKDSRINLKEKLTRAKIDFNDPFAQESQRQPMINLQAQLEEKRRVNPALDDVARQLKVAVKDSNGAQKRNGSNPPSLQPLSVSGQPASTQYRSALEAPPPGKKLAGSVRLPNCYTCICNETARHLHDIREENRHIETLERQAEEQLLQRRKQERQRLRAQEQLRRQTHSTWHGLGSPVVQRTPTTTWIEDICDVCSNPPTTTLPKDGHKTVPVTQTPANVSVRASETVAPPKVGSRTKTKAAPKSSTPTTPRETSESFPPLVDFVASSPQSVSSSDARAISPFWYSYADCVQALGVAGPAAKISSLSPNPKGAQNTERMKLRVVARKLLAAQKQAEKDAQWDNIDLSDDEEWDKVANDEDAEWEVLEK